MDKTLNPKHETLNKPQITNPKKFDLGDRTLRFTKRVVLYINDLPKTITSIEISKQLMRSAGSIGANYIEAEESLSKKDFVMRIKISKKEAKETKYWLNVTEPKYAGLKEKEYLIQEVTELMRIFGAIVEKSKLNIVRV